MDHWPAALVHKLWSIILYMDLQTCSYWPYMAYTPLIGGDSDLKSTEPWFSSFERNLPRPPIHWLRSKELATFKKSKSVLTTTEILIFPGFLSFFHDIFQNFKFA